MSDRELLELQEEIETLKARLEEVESRSRPRLRERLTRLSSSKPTRLALVGAVIAVAAVSYAAQISVPYTFVNGTVADATEVNANFSTLVTESNAQDVRLFNIELGAAGHLADPSAHHTKYTDPEAIAAILAADGSGSGLDADLLDGLDSSAFAATGDSYTKAEVDALLASINAAIATNTTDIATLMASYLPCATQVGNEVYFEGCNVNVQNDTGSTDGTPNGLGNLIVGYNENGVAATRSGSHNLVMGIDNEYTSYAGLVAGYYNTISGASASVIAGKLNYARGDYAIVSGGFGNDASGNYSSVSGGFGNDAAGPGSTVGGGYYNWAGNVCTGGTNPGAQCRDNGDCTGGGTCGIETYQSVSGGDYNEASGTSSSVSGGSHNQVSGTSSSVSGGYHNTVSHSRASVSGGSENTASGYNSSVSGGRGNEAEANYASVSGGYGNNASGDYSSVSGGFVNWADGDYASVSGGNDNRASGTNSSVSGGYENSATHPNAHVSGGDGNVASYRAATVSGGVGNTASGDASTVGGGMNRSATGVADWRAGGLWQDN